MKKSHLFGILIIASAITIIISTAGDASSYVTFTEARQMAQKGQNEMIHVVGTLKENEAGEIQGIKQSEDKLSFTFVMVDENNNVQKVYYNEPMPADFEKSEQVVVVGSYKDDIFVADKILMKCPSKYKEDKIS